MATLPGQSQNCSYSQLGQCYEAFMVHSVWYRAGLLIYFADELVGRVIFDAYVTGLLARPGGISHDLLVSLPRFYLGV
jgi:hypothetical protein